MFAGTAQLPGLHTPTGVDKLGGTEDELKGVGEEVGQVAALTTIIKAGLASVYVMVSAFDCLANHEVNIGNYGSHGSVNERSPMQNFRPQVALSDTTQCGKRAVALRRSGKSLKYLYRPVASRSQICSDVRVWRNRCRGQNIEHIRSGNETIFRIETLIGEGVREPNARI
jgi:hypothetical protein